MIMELPREARQLKASRGGKRKKPVSSRAIVFQAKERCRNKSKLREAHQRSCQNPLEPPHDRRKLKYRCMEANFESAIF